MDQLKTLLKGRNKGNDYLLVAEESKWKLEKTPPYIHHFFQVQRQTQKMKRCYVELGSDSFLEQLARTLFYHFFRSEKRYGRLTQGEKSVINHYLHQLTKFPNSIEQFCQYFGVNLRFWCQVHKNDIVNKIDELTCGSEHTIDILVTNYKVPFKFDLAGESNALNFFRLGFIPDLDRFPSEKINKTIFELLGRKLDKLPHELEAKWAETNYGKDGLIKFTHEKHFGQLFGVGFSIITVENTTRRRSDTRDGVIRHYSSKFDDFLILKTRRNFYGEKAINFTKDRFNLRDTDIIFECSNERCPFAATQPHLLKRHMETCDPGTKVKYVQKDMCGQTPREFLIAEGFLPADFRKKGAVFYDIESFAQTNRKKTGNSTEVLSTQRMVTISVTANFGTGPRTKVFTRDTFDKDDYVRVLREFTAHLKNLHFDLLQALPEQVHTSIEKIEEILEQNRSSNKKLLSISRENKFRNGLHYLKSLTRLGVFGFNSERYDLCILLPGLVDLWGYKNVEVIKRDAGYMMLQTEELRLLDVKNYIAGGSLSSFAQSWGAGCVKQVFPYQYFETIAEAKSCYSWPNYKYFFNDLTYCNVENYENELKKGFELVSHRVNLNEFADQLNCPEIIDQSTDKTSFPTNLVIPDSTKRFAVSPWDYCKNWEYFEELYTTCEIKNMFEFLQIYNQNDTEILAKAFENYCDKIWETFGVNPLEYFSLSQMSERIMFSEFDCTVNRPYSLADGTVNAEIRENQRGGLVIIFHKHAIANPSPIEMILYDPAVWSLRNGQIIRKIVCFDFNALYAAAMRNFLPTGYGFLYKKEENGFRWSCMKKVAGFSLESLEWIQYVQSQPPFTQQDGSVFIIRHALNGHEHETRFQRCFGAKYSDGHAIFSDGYANIAGRQYFLFFDGCRFHNCDICDTKCVSNHKFDDRRKQLLDLGEVIQIKGCEWAKLKKTVTYKHSISHFFNRKTLIQENEIFDAVKSGDFFGLIRVDIESPEHVIQKWRKLNFPLIPRHQDIDETMIAPNLVHDMKQRGMSFPLKKNLTLCFNAKNILITTLMAQFYFEQGCKLSNLQNAIEFERATPLKEFVNKATRERIAATRENNEQKQDLYKRIVNASYGRTGMRQDNRLKVKYEKHSRNRGSKLVKKRVPLIGEFETDLFEVTSEPMSFTDKVPGNNLF